LGAEIASGGRCVTRFTWSAEPGADPLRTMENHGSGASRLFHSPPARKKGVEMNRMGELRDRRAMLFAEADAILKRARQENRNLTSQERERFDELHDEIDE